MKAIVYEKYGLPEEVLELKEVEKPTPKDNEVLVKIFAASVNFNDLAFVKGEPFLSRLWTGFLKPKHKILGTDIAGRVEAVGKNVTGINPGDEVFAEIGSDGYGAFAEYVAVPGKSVVIKPANISFEEAAAVPQAAVTALQGLQDQIQIQPGQKVLVNGASGGIGTFAIQLAKSFGAEVTGVCSSDNLKLIRSIGADYVIDYKQEDFTMGKKKYDLILDIVANRPTSQYMHALAPQGAYVAVAFNPQTIFLGSIISKADGKKAGSLMAKPSISDLKEVKALIEGGKISPVINKVFPLRETAKAIKYYGEGAQGKVVISME
ncbi:MAG TPA: NAD(P)-dependent alcohol dehydrogenase [Anaerolineales bacterium]|nr:NAD(P)-dependent alcohol dehydrogenase [Anaerolineales bacterium]